MIDCHCHILPGVDDGAKTMNDSIEMARVAVRNGTTAIFATPHHLNGVFTNYKQDIEKKISEVQQTLNVLNIPLLIYPGSELHLVPELLTSLKNGDAMTYADKGKAVLIELPKHSIPTGALPIIENLLYSGITPIIAHPERNSTFRKSPDMVGEWIGIGCKLQLTSQSCTGEFGSEIQHVCNTWCNRGWVHLIASDAHRVEGRAPDLRGGLEAITNWLGKSAANIVCFDNPTMLLHGKDIVDVDNRDTKVLSKKKTIMKWFSWN